MIACCNDGTRPVIFKVERIDIPETDEEKQCGYKQELILGDEHGNSISKQQRQI
jgi:hypothetical protein